jgi:hypothetical protein
VAGGASHWVSSPKASTIVIRPGGLVMYINGKLVAVDPIDFIPHNQVNVDLLPEYPMTIAVAVNGVPIFNPMKNDGRTDTCIAGELDEFGGHCGRADDYHYHIAPLHLVDVVGVANPIGYARDGYKLYGLTKADGSDPVGLDEYDGHTGTDGVDHYHSTKTYPYVNGGMRGVVRVQNDAITPPPRTVPVRPAGDQAASREDRWV